MWSVVVGKRTAVMSHRHGMVLVGLAGVLTLAAAAVHADVFNMGGTRDAVTGKWAGLASLEFVTIGDPGNARDTNYPRGSVPYTYQVGEYDVTVAQYCQFLRSGSDRHVWAVQQLHGSRVCHRLPVAHDRHYTRR